MKLLNGSMLCLGLVFMMGIGSAEAACKNKTQTAKAAELSLVQPDDEVLKQIRQCALAATKGKKRNRKALKRALKDCFDAYAPEGGSCE